MTSLSPQVAELLLQVTYSQDLNEALHKVLREYLDLKLNALSSEIHRMEDQWSCKFAEFKERTRNDFSYEVEKDFWEWESLETLKSHYYSLRERWS